MSEAEKQAIRKAFAEDLAGTEFEATGMFTGAQPEILAEAGGDAVHQALVKRGWKVARDGAGDVSRADVVDELTGWMVTCRGTTLLGLGWDYSETISRSGAESIADRIEVKGWKVSK